MATAKARSPDANPRAPAVECKKKKKSFGRQWLAGAWQRERMKLVPVIWRLKMAVGEGKNVKFFVFFLKSLAFANQSPFLDSIPEGPFKIRKLISFP